MIFNIDDMNSVFFVKEVENFYGLSPLTVLLTERARRHCTSLIMFVVNKWDAHTVDSLSGKQGSLKSVYPYE